MTCELFKVFSSEFDYTHGKHIAEGLHVMSDLFCEMSYMFVAVPEQWRTLTCTSPSEVAPRCWPRSPSTVYSVCCFWLIWWHTKITHIQNKLCDIMLTYTPQCGCLAWAGLHLYNSPEILLSESHRCYVCVRRNRQRISILSSSIWQHVFFTSANNILRRKITSLLPRIQIPEVYKFHCPARN